MDEGKPVRDEVRGISSWPAPWEGLGDGDYPASELVGSLLLLLLVVLLLLITRRADLVAINPQLLLGIPH